MSATRPYREPLRRTAIVRELIAGRDSQWDPEPVDVALDMIRSGELVFEIDRLRVGEPPEGEQNGAIFSVLLVEDDPDHASLVTRVIRRAIDDVRVIHAPDVASAERLFTDCTWSLAVLDHNLPDGSGLDLLERLRLKDPGVPVLMMTGEGSERLAVEAFRRGASDYVVKGADSVRELQSRVRALLAA
jgi:CheY-like chemotaxis protein